MKDDLGDRLKAYEAQETERRLLPGVPIYARLDGRGFHKFTQGMTRPFDLRMMNAMRNALSVLVDKSNATLGYTQSDEISLAWLNLDHESEMWFGGKVHKLTSVLSGLATASFMRSVAREWQESDELLERLPHFDCRVLQVPNEQELANMFLWRNLDASRNSLNMAAHHYYSHKALQGVGQSELHELLYEKGVNWNNYPDQFKRGVFARKVTVEREFDPVEWASIPLAHRPSLDQILLRSEVQTFDLPPLQKVKNRAEALFHRADPQLSET